MRGSSAVAISVWLTGCASPCRASAPPEFAAFCTDLQADGPLRMTLLWPDPIQPIDHPVRVTVGPDGASASAGMGSVKTDGSTVTLAGDGLSVPLPDLADEAADLFEELRSGLSGSAWATVEPPLYGPTRLASDAAWARVTLPFDWASSEQVLLAVDRDSGALRVVLVETTDPPIEVVSRPPRGGPRTVRLSSGDQLKLVVDEYVRP